MRFRVTFVDLKKVTTVSADNLVEAEEWARRQLVSWGKESDFDVEAEEEE